MKNRIIINDGLRSIVSAMIIIAIMLMMNVSIAAAKKEPLAEDQAFQVKLAHTTTNQQLSIQFKIADGYYIYRDRVHFKFYPEKHKLKLALPKGAIKHDANGEALEIYKQSFNLALPNDAKSLEKIIVDFQGCSAEGFCYPPMHETLRMASAASAKVNAANENINEANTGAAMSTLSHAAKNPQPIKSLINDQRGIQGVLSSANYPLIILLFIGFGLLLAFTPCVLPMVPILTGIIIGQTQITTRKAFLLSLTYVLGTAVTYAIAGIVAALMGNSLQVWLQKPAIIVFVSFIFFLLSLSLFGFYELRLPNRMQRRFVNMSNAMTSGTFVGVFGMGVLSTLIVSPCVTAPLVGVLLYIGQSGNMFLGAIALFALGIGMGIPLLLIGTTAGKWLPKAGTWMEAIKKIFGVIMLLMAVWLLSRILSVHMADNLWKICLIVMAFVGGGYIPRVIGYPGFHRGIGILVSCCAIMLMIGGINLPNPITQSGMVRTEAANTFQVVHSISDLDFQLKIAKSLNKPVILDFYADWCDSCIAMDRNVFATDRVKKQLANYVLLRADLTANNEQDEALLKHFAVIAPPTILFFDTHGHEIDNQRIVGEIDAKEFLARLSDTINDISQE